MGNSLFALALVEEADHGVVVEEVGNQVVNKAVRLDRVHLGGVLPAALTRTFDFPASRAGSAQKSVAILKFRLTLIKFEIFRFKVQTGIRHFR